MPPVLAGRDVEIGLAEGMLEQLETGTPPSQDLLLYGPRGNGKTAILARIADTARDRGARVAELPVEVFTSKSELVSEMQRVAGAASAVVAGVQVGPLGVATDREATIPAIYPALSDWIQAAPTALVLVVDEVQRAEPGTGGAFFDAVQSAKRDAQRFLLVAAGTPDAPHRVRDMAPHNERGFRFTPVGRLTRRDAETALGEPARDSGLPMTEAAVELLAEESQDYPYFVQLLGRAAWDAAARGGADEIAEPAARAGIAAAAAEVARFYGNRYDEARARGVHRVLAPLARRFQERGGVLRDRELEPLLGADRAGSAADSRAWVELLVTLRDLGVLWEATPGRWELGIPSFARHVLGRDADGV